MFWTGGMGRSNWNDRDYLWEEEDEDGDLDYYLGDIEEDEEAEIDPVMPLPPPAAPQRCFTRPQCWKLPPQPAAGQHGPRESADAPRPWSAALWEGAGHLHQTPRSPEALLRGG